MGIFKKSKSDLDEILEVSDFEEPTESNEAETARKESSAGGVRSQAQAPGSAQNYGIEDAIALMRKLPNVNSEITITVVKKTLESAQIQVEEIIGDAQRKENQINQRTNQLSQEINQLQNRITQLNDEITTLTTDLKETTKVKELLQGSIAKQPEAESKPAAKSENKSDNRPRPEAVKKPGESAPGADAQRDNSAAAKA
jgi:chromosome segregation ATPase